MPLEQLRQDLSLELYIFGVKKIYLYANITRHRKKVSGFPREVY